MKKSTHFALSAATFGMCSVGFLLESYLALGGGVALLAVTYAALALRAHQREQRDS